MKTKKIIINVLSVLFGILLIFGAYNHSVNPDAYAAMIPDFIPDWMAHTYAIVAELTIGIALLIPRYRKYGALGFSALMLSFLPIHIWDLFRSNHAENPLIPSLNTAIVRFIVQLILITIGAWIYNIQKAKK